MKPNRKGTIGMPIRLAVSFLILALFVPVITDAVTDLEEQNGLNATNEEVIRMRTCINDVYYSGNGSSVTECFSIPLGYEIRIGGEGTDSYTISIIKCDEIVDTILLNRPLVRITDGITVHGNCELNFSSVPMTNQVEVVLL